MLAITLCSAAVFADINGCDVALTHGDTILVLNDPNTVHKVRLIGVDGQERGRPFGSSSRSHLESMVAGK